MVKFYKSKTLWANAIAIVGIIVGDVYGVQLSGEEAVLLLAMINIILRTVTKEPLDWSFTEKDCEGLEKEMNDK